MSAILLLTMVSSGCTTMDYAVKEKFGIHKRDILRSSIEDAKSEQDKASEQFQSALDSLMQLYNVDGGELEERYNHFSKQYDKSMNRAQNLRGRIDKVERVARDLFTEWSEEIQEIGNPGLRQKSQSKLSETRSKFQTLVSAFNSSESKMDAVLAQLKDQVLYLKHNLNASAISGLESELNDVQNEIIDLIKQIHISIGEAEDFINTLPE